MELLTAILPVAPLELQFSLWHAFRRRLGEITCADILSRDVVTVQSGTTLEETWNLLRWHRVRALPVVNTSSGGNAGKVA